MLFGLETIPNEKVPEYNFEYKQKVHLDKTPVFKSADYENFVGLISGDYYVHNPRVVRGMIKIAASERDCEIRLDTLWYVPVKELIKLIKRGEING
jgi:hypothetical protein